MNLKDLPVSGKKVLVRVDFNVPLDEQGNITDDTRISAALPTIEYLLSKNAAIILMSHLGRPKGKKDPKYSLAPCAKRLEKLLNHPVLFDKSSENLKPGEILLLENLRFNPAEENPEKDPEFAKNLAEMGDFYVNDAFGTAHRAHSSTAVIAQYFLNKSAPGFLLEKEIAFLGEHFKNPKHPFYAIIGGAKVSSKLGVLISLLEKVDALFIGGAMAYTFFKAQGIAIGNSLYEEELIGKAKEFLNLAKQKNIPIFFPIDLVIAKDFSNEKIITVSQGIEPGYEGVDIGPKTREKWADTLKNAQMIFWNGPLGVFEKPKFAAGTLAIAKTLAQLSAITIVGGGDSVAAINQSGLSKKFSHISTGGGATLEYIENGHLPGIDALFKK